MHEVGPAHGESEPGPLTLREARDRFEQAYVLRALERESWNQSRAARGLGVHRNTLLARCGIGSCGVPRPSLGGYVTANGGHAWGARRRRALLLPLMLPILSVR
jgi:Bacterial regulatory protein, Fis family